MLQRMFRVALIFAVLGQGIARADEPARSSEAVKVAQIAPQEVGDLRHQPGVVPHETPIPWKTVAIIAAVTAGAALFTSVLLSKRHRR